MPRLKPSQVYLNVSHWSPEWAIFVGTCLAFLPPWAKCDISNQIPSCNKSGLKVVPSLNPTKTLNGSNWSNEFPTGVGTCPCFLPPSTKYVMVNMVQTYTKNGPVFLPSLKLSQIYLNWCNCSIVGHYNI